MTADGTTIGPALSALFELCVPAVSGGVFAQTFPAHLVTPLSDAERNAYAIAAAGEAYRVTGCDGLILVWLQDGVCHLATSDGDPDEVVRRFLARLPDENAVAADRDPDAGHPRAVLARMPLGPGAHILIFLRGGDSEGFYASASAVTTGPAPNRRVWS